MDKTRTIKKIQIQSNMIQSSFTDSLEPKPEKVQTKLILETAFTKEIRIQMGAGQSMKDHRAPTPIIVHLLEGEIEFGVNGEIHNLTKGSILSLIGGITHNIFAKKDSIVRLSFSKSDSAERVSQVAQNP
jgi:quercetin dioxygenase-like cupin family protein